MRVLKLARQPCYRWLVAPFTDRDLEQACLANALFDAHRDDHEFGHRLLGDEAREARHRACDRTVWRICRDNSWWSVFGKKRSKNAKAARPAGSRRPRAPRLHRHGPERAVADRHHRAPHVRGQALPLLDLIAAVACQAALFDRPTEFAAAVGALWNAYHVERR